MKSDTISIKRENLQKAYEGACPDIKDFLNKLFPNAHFGNWEDVTDKMRLKYSTGTYTGWFLTPNNGVQMPFMIEIKNSGLGSSPNYKVEGGKIYRKK